MKQLFIRLFVLTALSFAFTVSPAVIESGGLFETFFVKWEKEPLAVRYNVFYREAGESSWIHADDYLIREYGSYIRADVLGIGAGTYEARIVPVTGDGSQKSAITVSDISVMPHERTGFAFVNGVVPGAYTANGTLKPDAQIIYVTDKNKNTVTANVKSSADGKTTVHTGLQPIIKAFESGYEDRPFVFRFIGKVTNKNILSLLDGGDITIKGSSNTSRAFPPMTIEGVGDDAVLYGFGIKTARAKRLEVRNLGFMLTESKEKDNVGINDNSEHLWIHHNDMFYGSAGSDADQVKGDGATDVKASTNITIAYNRYWDTGKTHLIGNSSSEASGNITIHHNFYNHSDSRHPRVRKHNVHVYNNYYLNVSTYGIGAVMASSIFAEKNYFCKTNRPMLISMQGTDNGIFSSEDGGMIKAFGNFMDSFSDSTYRPYSSSNTTDFDAFEVSSAAAIVPNNVKAKQGGATFNNYMIPSNYPKYDTQNDSAAVRIQVTTCAGRYWGGDFGYSINNGRSSEVISGLKTALQNYKSGLLAILGDGDFEPPITSVINRTGVPLNNTMNITHAGKGAFKINYTLKDKNNVRIDLFDMKGSRITTLVNTSKNAGAYQELFAANSLAAGMYLIKLRTGDAVLQHRVMVSR